jgi:hypothetical protein
VKEAADVGRTIADQVAPLALEVDRSLEQELSQDVVPEPVMEM